MLRIHVVALMVLLAGCTLGKRSSPGSDQPVPVPAPDPVVQPRPLGPLPPSTRPIYNLAGYPEAVREGYIDGCETAKQTAYGYKDAKRYDTDGQYRMGWDDGFSICRGT